MAAAMATAPAAAVETRFGGEFRVRASMPVFIALQHLWHNQVILIDRSISRNVGKLHPLLKRIILRYMF
jgi:hypothetical protein